MSDQNESHDPLAAVLSLTIDTLSNSSDHTDSSLTSSLRDIFLEFFSTNGRQGGAESLERVIEAHGWSENEFSGPINPEKLADDLRALTLTREPQQNHPQSSSLSSTRSTAVRNYSSMYGLMNNTLI